MASDLTITIYQTTRADLAKGYSHTRLAGRTLPVVAADIDALWTQAVGTPADSRIGQPVRQCEPLALEAHPQTRWIDRYRHCPRMPPYVERRQDHELAKVIDETASGKSRIAMLVRPPTKTKARPTYLFGPGERGEHVDALVTAGGSVLFRDRRGWDRIADMRLA
jgi:hypothetical protein